MKIDLDLLTADFDPTSEDRDKAVAAAELLLFDAKSNRRRIAFINGIAKGLGTALPDGPREDFSHEIAAIARFGVAGALAAGKLDPDRLNRLLWDPAGLQQVCECLAPERLEAKVAQRLKALSGDDAA